MCTRYIIYRIYLYADLAAATGATICAAVASVVAFVTPAFACGYAAAQREQGCEPGGGTLYGCTLRIYIDIIILLLGG